MKFKIDLHGTATALKRARNCAVTIRAATLSDHPHQSISAGGRVRNLICRGEQGSALVEFALILPMLLLLTTGTLVFGVAMNNYLQLTNAVSIGARTLAVNAQITLDPCAVASSAITSAAPGLTAANFTFKYTLNGYSYSGTSCASGSVSSGAAANLSSGSTATVTATYPLNLSVFGNKFSANNAVLQASSTELVQ